MSAGEQVMSAWERLNDIEVFGLEDFAMLVPQFLGESVATARDERRDEVVRSLSNLIVYPLTVYFTTFRSERLLQAAT